MIIDDLVAQLEPKFKELNLLHKCIGLSNAEKNNEYTELTETVMQAVAKHVGRAGEQREALRQHCAQLHESTSKWKRLMGDPVTNSIDTSELSINLKEMVDHLETEERALKKCYDQRQASVKGLFDRLEYFVACLGAFVQMGNTAQDCMDVSPTAIQQLEKELERCETEFARRAQCVEQGAKLTVHLRSLLGIESQTDTDRMLEQVNSESNAEKCEALLVHLVDDQKQAYMNQVIAQLEDIKQQREFRKKEIEHTLDKLWDRLQISPDEREFFLQTNRGLTTPEMDKYADELERMLRMKSEHLEDFVKKTREELAQLWDQLYYSDDQRRAFQPAYDDDFTESALEVHENEVARLQLLVEDSKYILDKIEKHMKLLQEIREFEARTSDPTRLFGGKGQRDPGRLLREEKFRKRISKELPRISKELQGALNEYQASTGKPFLVYGEPYLDQVLETEIHDENKAKPRKSDEQQQPTSKALVPPTTTRRQVAVSPMRPMTSPRRLPPTSPHRSFRSPQTSHLRTELSHQHDWNRADSTASTPLHRVRDKAIRKRPAAARQRLHDSPIINVTNDENVAPAILQEASVVATNTLFLPSQKKGLFPSDDELSIDDMGIFDGGPELSDMSDNDH